MATDFNPTFQTKYHEVVVPKLLQVLEDNDNPRVQAPAAAALVNFSKRMPFVCDGTVFTANSFETPILIKTKVAQLEAPGMKAVMEQSVTTLAAVSDASKDAFI